MDFKLPELGEGVYEAELVAWLVKPGDTVKRGQSLMEVLTDKASMEVPAPFAGTIVKLSAEPGKPIKVGEAMLSYNGNGAAENMPAAPTPDGNGSAAAAAEAPVVPSPRPSAPSPQLIRAAPSVRLMARQLGIDLTQVQGSGPGGRILIKDLTVRVPEATSGIRRDARPPEPRPDYGTPGTRVKLQGVRRKVADHMVLAKRLIPHYSYVDECEVTELVKLREALKETFAREQVKLTYLAFFVKAVTLALKEIPIVNSSLDDEAGEIVLHDRYHIGIATSTPSGLIVPVIHDADRKDLAQLAQEIERLSADARAGKAKLDDLRGGTFTITSIGNIGGLMATPVINHPETAIVAIGKIVKRPVYDAAGNIRPADLVYLSFSFDHRVVDGAVGAVFGNAVIRRLQNPAVLLLPDKLIANK